MKKLIVCMLLLIWSCKSFSQSIKPKIRFIDGTTHFCFTVSQSKTIAHELQEKTHSDSLIFLLQKRNSTYEKLLKVKDSIIYKTNLKLENVAFVSHQQAILNTRLGMKLEKEKKKSKRRSFLTKTGAILTIGLGFLILN